MCEENECCSAGGSMGLIRMTLLLIIAAPIEIYIGKTLIDYAATKVSIVGIG